MSHYVMLTRISPDAIDGIEDLEPLEQKVAEQVKANCPEVTWVGNYSVLGPYDYIDIFEAPDNETATKVALLVRSFGHATAEVWPAVPWSRFRDLTRAMAHTNLIGVRA